MLSRIVYFSRNLLRGPRTPGEGSLTDILRISRHNNAALGITGALLFDPKYFTQVLEGERSNVSHLFCKICRDQRHDAITLVEARPIGQRKFDSWSMALVRTQAGSGSRFDPTNLDADSLTDLLMELLLLQNDAINVSVPLAKSEHST